ncbi:MAG: LEA type 2 family protein [Saprospiraceae bacterium]|nr:LEA type 2 family protein [Saprospiraceae bacterium]
MKASCILKLLLLGGIGYYIFRTIANKASNNITLQKASVSFGNIDLTGVNLNILLVYENKNPFEIPLDSFHGFLMYGPVRLSKVDIHQPLKIMANSVTQIPVSSRINFLDLTSDIINLVKTKQFLQGLRVSGFLTVKGVSLDVDYPIQVI